MGRLKTEDGELHLVEFKIETASGEHKTMGGVFKKPTIKVLSAIPKAAEDDKIKSVWVKYNGTKVLKIRKLKNRRR
ncbi:MAG: hypothetical protein RIS47_2316 [Bacteroidota bacterium]